MMISARSVVRRGAVLLALAVAACSGATADHAPAAQGAEVVVTPDSAELAPAGQQAFAAMVTGTIDQSVTWTIAEGASGGTVTASGAYTAPGAAGSYHVVATSKVDPTKSAFAVVTVAAAPPPPPPPPAVTVSVSPKTAPVVAAGSQAFTCAVTGSSDTACTWSVQEGSAGGAVTPSGAYTAPATAGTYHVVAKSHADPTKSDVATVTVTAPPANVVVTISPTTAPVDACQTATLRATVTGTTNTAVTWSVTEGTAGGSVSTSGVYTAPATAGTYHVVTTSKADPTKSKTAAVTVTERIVSVSVSPQTVTVAPGGTVPFTATVTTTCGAFTQTQTILADGTIAAQNN